MTTSSKKKKTTKKTTTRAKGRAALPAKRKSVAKASKGLNYYLEHGTKSSAETEEALELMSGASLDLARTLFSIRTCEEIPQAEFARMLGISRQQLNDIEKGRRDVNVEKAAQFAEALGYPPSYFVRLTLQSLVDKAGLKLKVDIAS